jgi:hypothetical protein
MFGFSLASKNQSLKLLNRILFYLTFNKLGFLVHFSFVVQVFHKYFLLNLSMNYSYKGKILISTPDISGDIFSRSVVLVIEHNERVHLV